MKFTEFVEESGLTEVLGFDPEKKVDLGYFEHNIVRDNFKYTVLTLSKDFSLFLSNMTPETRYSFVKAMYDFYNHKDTSILHLVHQNKHLLVTLVHGSADPILHVEQRA